MSGESKDFNVENPVEEGLVTQENDVSIVTAEGGTQRKDNEEAGKTRSILYSSGDEEEETDNASSKCTRSVIRLTEPKLSHVANMLTNGNNMLEENKVKKPLVIRPSQLQSVVETTASFTQSCGLNSAFPSSAAANCSPADGSRPLIKCVPREVLYDAKESAAENSTKDNSKDKDNNESLSGNDKFSGLSKDAVVSSSIPLSSPVGESSFSTTGLLGFSSSKFGICVTSTSPSVSNFVFGENLDQRVQKSEKTSPVNGSAGSSQMLFSSAVKKLDGKGANENNESKKTLCEAAREYEESRLTKRKFDEVVMFTGEEDELNILQMECRLYTFDSTTSNWIEKGNGTLRLNDREDENLSRIIVRLVGSLRVILNAKIWPGMTVQRANKKSLRITAVEDNQLKVHLITANPKSVDELENCLLARVGNKKLKEDSA